VTFTFCRKQNFAFGFSIAWHEKLYSPTNGIYQNYAGLIDYGCQYRRAYTPFRAVVEVAAIIVIGIQLLKVR
jgi:hypothetical protein